MNPRRSDRIIAAIVAILIHAAILLVMLFTFLTWPPTDEPLPTPKEDESELLLAGEYVMIGDDPMLTTDDEASAATDASEPSTVDEPSQPDVKEEAPTAAPAPTKGNVPVKTDKTEKVDKAAREKEARERAERQKAEKERAEREAAAAKIRSTVKFNGNGSGEGRQGSPNGNATTGAPSGSPGHDLAGRTIESFSSPSSTVSGTIRVRVRVNASGQVVSATYDGGSGSAAANPAVRQSCVNASKRSRFSVRTDSQADQTGLITWRFK